MNQLTLFPPQVAPYRPKNGRRPHDLYPTERKVIRAFLNEERITGLVDEPCAGPGDIVHELLRERDVLVRTNDIDRAHRTMFHGDATDPQATIWQLTERPRWVVTNPPFNMANEILRIAWERATVGIAFLLRLSYLEPAGERSGNRGQWLKDHADHMTRLMVMGNPRPSFTGDGRTDSVTSAWMVWKKNFSWDAIGIAYPFVFLDGWK